MKNAWERFKKKMGSLKDRQKEILARFIKHAEAEELKKVRRRFRTDPK